MSAKNHDIEYLRRLTAEYFPGAECNIEEHETCNECGQAYPDGSNVVVSLSGPLEREDVNAVKCRMYEQMRTEQRDLYLRTGISYSYYTGGEQ